MIEEEREGGELMNKIKRKAILWLDFYDQSKPPWKVLVDWPLLCKHAAGRPLKKKIICYIIVYFRYRATLLSSPLKVLSSLAKETAFI